MRSPRTASRSRDKRLRMNLPIRQSARAGVRRESPVWRSAFRLRGAPLLLGICLLAAALAGCKPASGKPGKPALDKSGKPVATNAAAASPRVPVRPSPVAVLPPGVRPVPASALQRPFARTNALGFQPRSGPPGKAGPQGIAPSAPAAKAGPQGGAPAAKAVAAVQTAPAKGGAAYADQLRRLLASRYFYPVVTVVALCLSFGAVSLFQFFKSRSAATGQAGSGESAPKVAGQATARKVRRVPISSCNVLQVGPEARQIWQFTAKGRGFVLHREQTTPVGQPLPARIVAKDWRNLWQRKLNIAWLPPEQVFLRVAQFPVSNFDETVSMVELQLEKLSPMPATQIVWSIRVLPHIQGNLQTVIVMIAGRNAVEEFLGKLEGEGYLADRLEMPRLDQLQATVVAGDGAWIYPEPGSGSPAAVVAWWYAGVLQNLALITLSHANRGANLKEQLLQMAWAGELEGWLTAPPKWHLVADPRMVAEWEPALREGLEQDIDVIPTLASAALAALTAQRVAQAEPEANLLPPEYSVRYQQQFIDRLWMGGLGALIGVYLLGLLVYFAWLQVAEMGTNKVEQAVANLGQSYTNSMQLKARFQVLKDRQDLKWAALDCWKAVAELLPDGVQLESYNFNDGRRLSLNGTAPADQSKRLLDFDADLRKATANGQPLFDSAAGEHLTYHQGVGNTLTWSCVLELKRGETL